MDSKLANFFTTQIEGQNLKYTGLAEVRLLPWGRFEANGKTHIVDEESAAAVLAAFEKHGVALPIDVNHETHDPAIRGSQKIGAVGWIESLKIKPGTGIFGLVNWADEGRNRIRSGAFQYLSPSVMYRVEDGKVMELDSAALVTKPAIAKMDRLEASQNNEKDVAPGADSEGALLRAQFGLAADASTEMLLSAMKGRESLELAEMRKRDKNRSVDELFEKHALGKVNPNAATDVAICREVAGRDPERFVQWMRERPEILPKQGLSRPPSHGDTLRYKTVREAKEEFHNDPRNVRLASCEAFVNAKLAECGQIRLSKDELQAFAIL